MKTVKVLLLLLAFCWAPLLSVAQVAESELPQESSSNAVRAMESTWTTLSALLPSGDLRKIHEQVLLLARQKEEAGIAAVEAYSDTLLREAGVREGAADIEGATYLTRKALELSPASPRVMFHALPLAGRLQVASQISLAMQAILLIPRDPTLFAYVVLHALYPTA